MVQEQELSELAANPAQQIGRAARPRHRSVRHEIQSHSSSEAHSEAYRRLAKEELEEQADRSSALRAALCRNAGWAKLQFAHLQDLDGKIQIYVREDSVRRSSIKAFDLLDIGDMIGVKGVVFKTKTGETSVKVQGT